MFENRYRLAFQNLLVSLIFSLFLLQTAVTAQPIDSSRSVIIESIKIGQKLYPKPYDRITITDKDSIIINFKLQVRDNKEREAFLFQTVFKNSLDSSVKTLGVTSAMFNKLREDDYLLRISAFDLQRKWMALPVEIRIEVDNEKAELIRARDSLQSVSAIDSPEVKIQDSTSGKTESAGNSYFRDVFLVVIGILVVAALILLIKIAKKVKAANEVKYKSATNEVQLMQNTVNNDEYEKLQMENSRLRAEIASLRGQIDAMNMRSSQLTQQNKDLQKNVQKLSKSKDELEDLQKQKDDLFAVIIHDIKNPAALIKSLVELLTSYDLTANEQQEIIADIANTTIKIVALSQEVSRILSLETNKLNLNFEKTEINAIVMDVFTRNQIAAKTKSIHMFTDLEAELPDVDLDPQRIDEVLDNLISNAIKFTQNGGTVRIKSYRDSSGVAVEVTDNGLGLTEEDLKHAFQRGARLSAKPTQGESSTGLGLWIVKKLVDAHKGRVWVKSTVGKGSTFSFLVPIKQTVEEKEE